MGVSKLIVILPSLLAFQSQKTSKATFLLCLKGIERVITPECSWSYWQGIRKETFAVWHPSLYILLHWEELNSITPANV